MRNYLLLLTMTLSMSLSGQNYHPLLSDSITWYISYTFEGTHTEVTSSSTDTIINASNYKITSWGLIREDTVNQSVYIRLHVGPDSLTNEILLYDFSLEVGDTVYIERAFSTWSGNWVVDSINNLMILSGPRKTLYLHKCDEQFLYTTYWIEEVGSLSGLYDNIMWDYPFTQINCIFKNETHIFQSDSAQVLGCDFSYNINDISKYDLSIYPNPCSDKLNIVSDNNEIMTMVLYNVFGVILTNDHVTKSNKSELDLSSIPKGIYFLRVATSEIERTIKVIKYGSFSF